MKSRISFCRSVIASRSSSSRTRVSWLMGLLGLNIRRVRNGCPVSSFLRCEPVSVLLTDLMMPGMSGLDLLKASRSVSPETETILMTAYGTVENAVEAMRQGAYDFVTKPLKRAHVVRAVTKALEKRNLVQENRSLRAQLAAQRKKTLIGQSLP